MGFLHSFVIAIGRAVADLVSQQKVQKFLVGELVPNGLFDPHVTGFGDA